MSSLIGCHQNRGTAVLSFIETKPVLFYSAPTPVKYFQSPVVVGPIVPSSVAAFMGIKPIQQQQQTSVKLVATQPTQVRYVSKAVSFYHPPQQTVVIKPGPATNVVLTVVARPEPTTTTTTLIQQQKKEFAVVEQPQPQPQLQQQQQEEQHEQQQQEHQEQNEEEPSLTESQIAESTAKVPISSCCAEPPIESTKTERHIFYPVENETKNIELHDSDEQTIVRENTNHIQFKKTIVTNVNRHHLHTLRVVTKENHLNTFITNNIVRVNDIHHNRVEHVTGEKRELNDFQQTMRIDEAAKCVVANGNTLEPCEKSK